jgi:hypothetical protein
VANRRTQLDWTEIAVKVLQERAQEAGLLGMDERLVYTAPDRKAGTEATLEVWSGQDKRPRPFWLPTLLPKDTNRTAERLADVAAQVLYSIGLQTSFNRAMDAQD